MAGGLGGASEFITHNENGFLVGPADAHALRNILSRLCSDRDRLAELSAAATETAADHPTWGRLVRPSQRIYVESGWSSRITRLLRTRKVLIQDVIRCN
ncbi:glycosyltransferase [Halovenus sp. HT40]|uniref:glycosyltransferase n=1 Tax=Halovenus sp. HT40 TaxID=3126691 RepID=UPI003FA5A022